MSNLIGKTVGGFLIEEELGRGAMGVVFKARQLSMDRPVALKFLPTKMAQNERLVQRFLREARAAGQLSHPNIVGVHDAGKMKEGLHFIAMEYVDGNSVHKRIREKGPYTEKEALDIAGQIAEALKFAHGRGILHRDIKPDNFLIDQGGRVRLADLGLARFQSKDGVNDAELTQDGTALGTPHYMAPEQCKGLELDARSDLYSLGVSLYVLVCGQTPYEGNTSAAVMVKVLTEPPRPLKLWLPDCSAGFLALVEKAMHKDPVRRFQDAQQFIDAIEKCKSGTYRAAAAGAHKAKPAAVLAGRASLPADAPDFAETSEPAPPSRAKLVLGGAGAALAALVVLGILSQGKRGADGSSDATPPVPAAANAKQDDAAKAEPKENKSGAKPADASDASAATKDPELLLDPKPEVAAAMKAWRRLAMEQREQLAQNPKQVAEKIEEFLEKHPYPRLRTIALGFLGEARDQQRKLETEWQALEAAAREDAGAGRKPKAFFALLAFADAHPGTGEGALARAGMEKLLGEFRQDVGKLAEAGEYDQASLLLQEAIGKLSAEMAAPFKEDLEKVTADRARMAEAVAADGKRLVDLYEQSCAQARETDAASGRRYDFAAAAKAVKDGSVLLKTAAAKKDAEALAFAFTRAQAAFEKMRGKTADLPGLGGFKTAGKLIAWEERGLVFKPNELSPQSVPWKSISPESLLSLAQALKLPSTTPKDAFDYGALAFAAGVGDVAEKKLADAGAGDAELKDKAEILFRYMRPAQPPAVAVAPVPAAAASSSVTASPFREALAKKFYQEALAARERKDAEAVQKTQAKLVVDFADTEFVQSHRKQIDGLAKAEPLPPEENTEKAPEKTAEREKPPEKMPDKPADAKDPKDAGAAAVAELKKAGFTDVKGNWTQDARRKTAFSLTGGGQLGASLLDGVAQVSFQLQEGATLGVYARYEPEDEIGRGVRKNLEAIGFALGPGYGIQIEAGTATVYGDRAPGAGKGAKKNERFVVPIKIASMPLAPGLHSIQVAARGEKLEITLDGRNVARSNDKLRAQGEFIILIEGDAKIDSPSVVK